MSLPTYDKSKRRQSFEQLPKDAYIVKIIGVRQEKNKNGNGEHLTFAFDIAEGEYKDFWNNRFQQMKASNDDAKWPNDAIYYLTIPENGMEEYIFTSWNTFFADLEDSNNGFVFDGDIRKLKGKILGGKFHIEQTEYNGNVYDHTRLKFTCVAEDVRQGKAGKLPKDKLLNTNPNNVPSADADGFMNIPDGIDEEVPF